MYALVCLECEWLICMHQFASSAVMLISSCPFFFFDIFGGSCCKEFMKNFLKILNTGIFVKLHFVIIQRVFHAYTFLCCVSHNFRSSTLLQRQVYFILMIFEFSRNKQHITVFMASIKHKKHFQQILHSICGNQIIKTVEKSSNLYVCETQHHH